MIIIIIVNTFNKTQQIVHFSENNQMKWDKENW